MRNFDTELTPLTSDIINGIKIKQCLIERVYTIDPNEWVFRLGVCLDSNDKYCIVFLSNFKSEYPYILYNEGYSIPDDNIYYVSKEKATEIIKKLSVMKSYPPIEDLIDIDDVTFNKYMNAIVSVSSLPITFISYIDHDLGYYNRDEIVVSINNTKINILTVTLHEIAHAYFKHYLTADTSRHEFEATFLAFYVLTHYALLPNNKTNEIDTTIDFITMISFLYSQYDIFSINKKEKNNEISKIVNASKQIITKIDYALKNSSIPEQPSWTPSGLFCLSPEDNDKLLDIIINDIAN